MTQKRETEKMKDECLSKKKRNKKEENEGKNGRKIAE